MTTVYHSFLKPFYYLHCVDHASVPVVCAAVSMVMQTAEGWAINHEDRIKDHRSKLAPGDCMVSYTAESDGEAVMDACFIALCNLAETYPKEVRIEDRPSSF